MPTCAICGGCGYVLYPSQLTSQALRLEPRPETKTCPNCNGEGVTKEAKR